MIEWVCRPGRILNPEKTDMQVDTSDLLASRPHGQLDHSLLQHAVETNDMELLKFVIRVGGEQKALLADDEEDQRCYAISSDVFRTAIRLGRTAILAEMIKARTSYILVCRC